MRPKDQFLHTILIFILSSVTDLLAGQLRVKDEYLQQDFKLDTPLEYFIPTTTGPGACTFSLVHYLTYVHNNFMEFCRSKTKSR